MLHIGPASQATIRWLYVNCTCDFVTPKQNNSIPELYRTHLITNQLLLLVHVFFVLFCFLAISVISITHLGLHYSRLQYILNSSSRLIQIGWICSRQHHLYRMTIDLLVNFMTYERQVYFVYSSTSVNALLPLFAKLGPLNKGGDSQEMSQMHLVHLQLP